MKKTVWLLIAFPFLLFAQNEILLNSESVQSDQQISPQKLEQSAPHVLISPTTPVIDSPAEAQQYGTLKQAQSVLSNIGVRCRRNGQCQSGNCANNRRCAPADGTGKDNGYCHHDNHCKSKWCSCPKRGAFGFCADWEKWPETNGVVATSKVLVGFCNGPFENGSACNKNEHCESRYCADGKRCAPKNFTGGAGTYCHHDNHCNSKQCICPGPGRFGSKSWGFCADWEKFSPERVNQLRKLPSRTQGRAFLCL